MLRKSKLWFLCHLIYRHYQHCNGIFIPEGLKIGGGIKFLHSGSIIIAQGVIIVKNCSIHNDVTIGRSFSGNHFGVPKLGDNIVIFPGARIIGNIKIGSRSIVGANSVVINDVPSDVVVSGVPAKIVKTTSKSSFNGTWKKFFCHD